MSRRTTSTGSPPRAPRKGGSPKARPARPARARAAPPKRNRLVASRVRLSRALELRGALKRIPRAALACALVATLNAACWSILTPPFQIPDEPAHFAYVKQLADSGRLPSQSAHTELSREEIGVLAALHVYEVREQQENRPIASSSEQAKLDRTLAEAEGTPEPARVSAGVAAPEPPLFYALEAVPYSIGGSFLTRLELMRLLSALLGGLTALFVFMFVREALPRVPWAWTVGGLCVALCPLLGFMSGAVNPDALLFAVSAAVFYLLARAFRRGLDTGTAIALGVAIAAGYLTKLNFVGLVPGIFLGIAIVAVRGVRASPRAAYRPLAILLALAGGPILLDLAVHLASGRPALGVVSGGIATSSHESLSGELSYIWQLYLPRLPGMSNYFRGISSTRQIWFDGYVGLYGWLDTPFPAWVNEAALIPAGLILVLCARGVLLSHAALRGRAAELAVYAAMSVGLMALVGGASYHVFPRLDAEFGQVRYLLPLLALLGAVLVLAVRGAGRRWGPAVGTLIVLLFFAHDLFSQLQVVARFYG
jgi:predicted membrane protein DUF2142